MMDDVILDQAKRAYPNHTRYVHCLHMICAKQTITNQDIMSSQTLESTIDDYCIQNRILYMKTFNRQYMTSALSLPDKHVIVTAMPKQFAITTWYFDDWHTPRVLAVMFGTGSLTVGPLEGFDCAAEFMC